MSWQEALEAPTYVIHLDRHTQRRDICLERVKKAGYTDVRLVPAVDGHVPEEWARHPIEYDGSLFIPKAAGCLLSHLKVWKEIIDQKVPFATVLEDDCVFHCAWDELAPKYYAATPVVWDMIYMGHHCGNVYPDVHIARVPVYCTNAYMVTLEGAQKLYEWITRYPYHDYLHAIDMMLVRLMQDQLQRERFGHSASHLPFLQWYVWNSQMFPDAQAAALIHPDLVEKDKGLVFQEWMH